jgi:hypothetical protein
LQLALASNDAAPPGSQTVNPDQLPQACRALAHLLASNSVEAGALLQAQGALLQLALGGVMGKLQREVENFDFSQALGTLRLACGNASITLD